ncbi:MAG: DUF1598 domain-containing protein [Pirellulales bacterium]
MARTFTPWLVAVFAAALLCTSAPVVMAQGGNISISGGPAGGIEVDPAGVIKLKAITDDSANLALKRIKSLRASAEGKLAKSSKMRKISLTRLEKVVAEAIAKGEQPSPEMLNLAGLTRVEYVFLSPETKDVIIAGPAEPFTDDPTGRMIGMETGRAIVQLEDLVVALRAFPPGSKPTGIIRCSIDPTKEGIANLQRKVGELVEISRKLRRAPGAAEIQRAKEVLKESQGLHQVTIGGVSPKTHFAKTLVEADYRMKLIGLGLDRPPVKITSFVSRLGGAGLGNNSLVRWYFVPDYQCLRVSADENALQLVGEGVKLVGEDELVNASGERKVKGGSNSASKAFTTSFTANYAKLAHKAPVYAELRNLIDLSVAAAFMQAKDYYGKIGWRIETFGDEKKFAVETYNSPKQVEPVCTVVGDGGRLTFPIAGGVTIQPREAISSGNLLQDSDGAVAKKHAELSITDLPADQWWWD